MAEVTDTIRVCPEYGASDHYLDQNGEEYFAWQSGGGDFAARINIHKFGDVVSLSDTVIDFGCGGGFLLNRLKCRRAIGIEINPAARRHAQSLGIECYLTTDDVPDGVADVIISDHVLEHVPYPIGALRSLRKKLRAKGTLRICVPIDNWRHQRVYNPHDSNHHLHTWTPQSLGNTLSEAGFEIRQIYARIFAWPKQWTVACYGRLPFPVFRTVCWAYGALTGRGWEILVTACPKNSPEGNGNR